MFYFYLAAAATLALFVGAGTLIGTRASEPKDYSLGGRKSSAAGVTGILLGALVGGASTVGTVQMAYSHGLTAIWFTLGGGVGCLLLGLRFAVPLRNSNVHSDSRSVSFVHSPAEGALSHLIAFSFSPRRPFYNRLHRRRGIEKLQHARRGKDNPALFRPAVLLRNGDPERRLFWVRSLKAVL